MIRRPFKISGLQKEDLLQKGENPENGNGRGGGRWERLRTIRKIYNIEIVLASSIEFRLQTEVRKTGENASGASFISDCPGSFEGAFSFTEEFMALLTVMALSFTEEF